MKIYAGELRFCEDCIHRTIVNGLQNVEIWCKRFGIQLKSGSEANQCFLCDFEETTSAKEARKSFLIGKFDHIIFE